MEKVTIKTLLLVLVFYYYYCCCFLFVNSDRVNFEWKNVKVYGQNDFNSSDNTVLNWPTDFVVVSNNNSELNTEDSESSEGLYVIGFPNDQSVIKFGFNGMRKVL